MEENNSSILVVDDNPEIHEIIQVLLGGEGYLVETAGNGVKALEMLSQREYDLIILDIMMPKKDGLSVLKEMRRKKDSTPVILLTAKDSVEDRVAGLDAGANDYLVKPFSFEELMARLRALTRNSFGVTSNVLSAADLTVDCATQTVRRNGRIIELSAKEYALLEYLIFNKGIVLSREKIENHVWNFDYEGGTNVVDVYISYLRKKIDDGQNKKLIHTLRGRGYVLKEE